MRAALVALALLIALPGATAQETAPADASLLEDAAGDPVATADAGGMSSPALPGGNTDAAKSADLLALTLVEGEDDLAFDVLVGASSGTGSSTYAVLFTWVDQTYRVTIETYDYGAAAGDVDAYGYLEHLDRDQWEYVSWLEASASVGAVHIVVPKVYVLDKDMRAPGRGDSLTGIAVSSLAGASGGISFDGAATGASFRDAMPDSGEGAVYTCLLGDFATGTLSLVAPQRMRVSNGGATTIVYPVTLRNTAAVEDRFSIAAVDVPSDWGVQVPGSLSVPAKAEKTVNVLASIPFAHKHGGFDSFNVTFQSERDAATAGKVRLGVLHTPIPQPAGHHNALYLHAEGGRSGPVGEAFDTTFPYAWGYMNTNETHEGESAGMTPNWYSDGEAGFYVWLNPSLEIGLDFDLTQLGSFVGSFVATMDGPATVTADLRLWRDGENSDEGILLAESDVAAVDLVRDQPVPFSLVMTPTTEADYVAFAPDQYMALTIGVAKDASVPTFFRTGDDLRLMSEDFLLTLPLLEYHDRLDGLAEAVSGLALAADGPVEKAGRPGSILTYAFTLTNAGVADMEVDLDVAGGGAEFGSLVPDGVVEIEAGATRVVTLAVSIPAGAVADEAYEVLVFAHAVDDPSKTAIARTRTTVTFGSEATPDESAVLIAAQNAERDSPGAGAFALLAAVGVAVLLARRR